MKKKRNRKLYSAQYYQQHSQRLKLLRHKRYLRNTDAVLSQNKTWYLSNRKKHATLVSQWMEKHPWFRSYSAAKSRCTNRKHKKYSYYGGRGVKLLMSIKDFRSLWFRDKAYLMDRPSIDRIDANGHYVLENCRYIEFLENVRRKKTPNETPKPY